MKVNIRKKEAMALERGGASPRSVSMIRPRELSKDLVYKIFFREQELIEENGMDLLDINSTSDEDFEKKLEPDTIINAFTRNQFRDQMSTILKELEEIQKVTE